MNAKHTTPPGSGRSRRRPSFWFPAALALALALLASAAYGVARAQPETVTIGHGATVRVQGVSITNLSGTTCQFTVEQSTEAPGGDPPDLGEMSLQWDISSPNCGNPQGNLTFHYEDGDLWEGVDEDRLRAFLYVGAGAWEDQCTVSCVDTGLNEVSVGGVDLLGDWTIGDLGDDYPPYPSYPGPTAVSVRGPARGVSLDESALVLGLSLLAGAGLILGWRLRKPAGAPQQRG